MAYIERNPPVPDAEFIISPVTGRQVRVGSIVYKRLLRTGALGGAKSAADVINYPKAGDEERPPPPTGYCWRKRSNGTPFLARIPARSNINDTMALAARAHLRTLGQPETPEAIAMVVRGMQDILIADAARAEAPATQTPVAPMQAPETSTPAARPPIARCRLITPPAPATSARKFAVAATSASEFSEYSDAAEVSTDVYTEDDSADDEYYPAPTQAGRVAGFASVTRDKRGGRAVAQPPRARWGTRR